MSATAECKFCNRKGLPLLPMRLAYVPQHHGTLPSDLVQGHPALAPVHDGAYALRTITEGYVYVLDMRAGGFWRCYGATASGHFKEYPLDAPPTQPPTFQCGREGHAPAAAVIGIEHASEAQQVWVGYTRVWLSKAARAKLKSDANLRSLLMTNVAASQIVKGGAVAPHTGARVTDADHLARLVGEYRGDKDFPAIDHAYAKTNAPAVKRSAQALPQIKAMHAMSPGNAIVLALPDPIGIVQDINHWRNQQAGALAKYQADPVRTRKRTVADLIVGIRDGAVQQGQTSTWTERYAPKVDMRALEKFKADDKRQIQKLDADITKASADWCAWTNHKAFKAAWQPYLMPDAAKSREAQACGLALERDMADCVFGSGGTPKEQQWWSTWLTAKADDKEHPLWLALAAGDKSVIDFALGDAAKPLDFGKVGTGGDLVKQSRDMRNKFKEWHAERKKSGLTPQVQPQSGLLAYAMAAQVAQLSKAQPQKALVAGQRLRVLIASRMDILMTPHAQQVTMQQLVVQLHETVWGLPKVQLNKTVKEAKRLTVSQGVDGAWLGTRFTSTKVVATEIWLPDELALKTSGGIPPALPAPKGATGTTAAATQAAGAAAGAVPAPNLWRAFTEYLKGNHLVGQGLLGLGAAMQLSNLVANLIQWQRAEGGNADNKDTALFESKLGVLSGAMGVMSLTSEVMAGTLKARTVPGLATAAAGKLLSAAGWIALSGGMLGALSAAVDLLLNAKKGFGLQAEGDTDAAKSTFYVAALSGVGAAGMSALAIIGAAELFAAAGATGAAVGGGALAVVSTAGALVGFIPVFGWIALVIGVTVAGIYFAFKASTQEDTPLEKWLSRCAWRNEATYSQTTRKLFANSKEEMTEFQQAIYGLSASMYWNDRPGRDELEITVTLPGYKADVSKYAFYLELVGENGTVGIARQPCDLSNDLDLRTTQPNRKPLMDMTTLLNKDDIVNRRQPLILDVQKGLARLAAKLRLDEDKYQSARLKFEYWPDARNQRELKMTAGPAGSNLILAAD